MALSFGRIGWGIFLYSITFLTAFSFSMVLPTLYADVLALQGDALFYGFVMAVFTAGVTISSLLFVHLMKKGLSLKNVFVITCFVGGVGNLIYWLSVNKWMLLVARFIAGFGLGQVGLVSANLASVWPTRRTMGFALLDVTKGVSYSIGAICASLTSLSTATTGSIRWNGNTTPAFMASVLFFIMSLLSCIPFRPDTAETPTTRLEEQKEEPAAPTGQGSSKLRLFAIFAVVLLATTSFVAFETGVIPLLQDQLHFSQFDMSLVVPFLGLALAILSLVTVQLRQHFQLRVILLVAVAIMMLGTLLVFNWGNVVPDVARIAIAAVVIGGAFGICLVALESLFSQMLTPEEQNMNMVLFIIFISLGRLLGPIWAGICVGYITVYATFYVSAALPLVAAVCVLVAWKHLVPLMDENDSLTQPLRMKSVDDDDDDEA